MSKMAKWKYIQITLLLMALYPYTAAQAHPVSYMGALSTMTWNQSFLSDTWVTYTVHPRLAFAARYMRMEMPTGRAEFYLPQADLLLHRWNEKNYQANIYMYGGYGAVNFQNQISNAGLVGGEADIESRKYFLSGQAESMWGNSTQQYYQYRARVGVAPYEAEFEELAAWFMIQAQYNPTLTQAYAITPLVRLFYKNILWETGVSFQGNWMLNFMVHF